MFRNEIHHQAHTYRQSLQVYFSDKVLIHTPQRYLLMTKICKMPPWWGKNTAFHFSLSIYNLFLNGTFDLGAAVLRTLARFDVLVHKIYPFVLYQATQEFLSHCLHLPQP